MWTKIFFNAQSILSETEGSVLIKMPNRSDYNGWAFWHPRKLVREQGGKGYHLTFSFNEEWKFNVKLYGKGRFNRLTVIKEKIIYANEMKKIFKVVDETVNEFVQIETLNIIEKTTEYIDIEHHKPEIKERVNSNEINELKKTNKC